MKNWKTHGTWPPFYFQLEIRLIYSVLMILHYSVYGNGNATLYSRTKPVLIMERKCHYVFVGHYRELLKTLQNNSLL